jgi:hypothetical protein
MNDTDTEASSSDGTTNKLKGKKIKNNEVLQDMNIFPPELLTLDKIYLLKEQLKNISWDKEGKNLLKKNYFTEEDKKIYKLLLIKGEIPSKYRGEFWYISTGGKRELINHPNYYKYILEKYPKSVLSFDKIGTREQIEKDLRRTFPGEEYFKDSRNIEKLRNILTCYFNRNLSGYTQGCNFIVGRLLEFIGDEEKVFWTFSQLMENILTVDYFSQMLGVYVEVDILMCLLRDLYTPNMLKKLDKNDKIIYLQNILLQWFISLFIIKFPKNLQLFIWDIFFIEKKIVLYKVSISLLHKYKNEIASADSIESLNKFLDETFSKFNDAIFLKYILLIKNFEFDDEFLNLNRRNFMEIKKKMWEKDNIKKIQNIKEKLLDREDLCNVNWPICIYDPSLKYQYNDSLIYRQLNDNNNIIEDYFKNDKNLRGKQYFSLKDNTHNRNIDYDTVLIERKPHFCKNYNKNVSNDLENESNSSKISSEDEFKIEVEDYLEKKKKYKNIRKMSNIGVCSYLYYKNLNSKNKNRINDKDENNLEKFISKGLINYSKYSLQNLSLQQLPNNFLSKVNS